MWIKKETRFSLGYWGLIPQQPYEIQISRTIYACSGQKSSGKTETESGKGFVLLYEKRANAFFQAYGYSASKDAMAYIRKNKLDVAPGSSLLKSGTLNANIKFIVNTVSQTAENVNKQQIFDEAYEQGSVVE